MDVVAIFPFEILLKTSSNINGMLRITKLGRLQKLMKLTRLLRILKMMKNTSTLMKFTQQIFKLGNGFERIVFFIFSSLMVCHISACLWIFFTKFLGKGQETWLNDEKYESM